MRRPDEGTLSRLMVEGTILLAAPRHNGTNVLKDAAALYKVDTEGIGQKVKHEFAAKAKAKRECEPEAKPVTKAKKTAYRPSPEGWQACRLSFLCALNLRRKTPLRFLSHRRLPDAPQVVPELKGWCSRRHRTRMIA